MSDVNVSGRMATIQSNSTLRVEECGVCGILFAAPASLLQMRSQDGLTFFCPNGHGIGYVSTNADLKRKLNLAKDQNAALTARIDQDTAQMRSLKGSATRARNRLAAVQERAAAGVCPCCNRTFKQLAQHMASKHPGYPS
jgi:hypothetical protein